MSNILQLTGISDCSINITAIRSFDNNSSFSNISESVLQTPSTTSITGNILALECERSTRHKKLLSFSQTSVISNEKPTDGGALDIGSLCLFNEEESFKPIDLVHISTKKTAEFVNDFCLHALMEDMGVLYRH